MEMFIIIKLKKKKLVVWKQWNKEKTVRRIRIKSKYEEPGKVT